MSEPISPVAALQNELMAFALTLPEAYEDHPWGETVTKVRNKIFVFWGGQADTVVFSLKLPRSQGYALSLPFAKPTGYNLGKSGWVSFQTTDPTTLEAPLVKEWIIESYRTVAPKKLAALINAGGEWHKQA